MTGREADWFHDDERLLAELGAAVRDGSEVPSWVRDIGAGAYAWRSVDAELALLESDGLDAGPVPAGLRGEASTAHASTAHAFGPRALRFVAGELVVELELDRDALRGQLVPAQPARVRVRPAEGAPVETAADDLGWFVVAPAPQGAFRVHVRPTAGGSVLTEEIVADRA